MPRKRSGTNKMALYRKFLVEELTQEEEAIAGLAHEEGMTIVEARAQLQIVESGCDPAIREAAARHQARVRMQRFKEWLERRSPAR
jgi:hypothetical protein